MESPRNDINIDSSFGGLYKMEKKLNQMREESKKMREESKRLREESKKLREEGKKLREESKRFREESNTIFENIINRLNILKELLLIKDNSNESLEETEIDDKMAKNIDIGNNKCIICLNNYMIHDKISYLPCFHLFHSRCIKEWIKRSNKCPICKRRINQL